MIELKRMKDEIEKQREEMFHDALKEKIKEDEEIEA
jgi:hypothetical protein